MATNQWARYAVNGPPNPSNAAVTANQPSSDDPWKSYAVGSSAPATTENEPSSPPSTSPSTSLSLGSADPWNAYATNRPAPTEPSAPSQESIPTQPQNQNFLQKAWHFANTPLLEDFGAPAQIKGQSGALGGVERGLYQVGMGLTSPLSIALTIGTLGTGGFLESAGASVLKDTLMAGADGLDEAGATAKVAQFAKAAQAAKEAMTTGAVPVSRAVESTGMGYNEFRSLTQLLSHTGVTPDHLLDATEALKSSLMADGEDAETAAREATQIQQKANESRNVLREKFIQDGLSPENADAKVSQFEKAAQASKDALANQNAPVSAAVKAASGMDYDEFTHLGNVLQDNGLTQNDVIGDNITRRLMSSLWQKVGATPVQAQRIAKGTETLLGVGFTGQQLSSAFHEIPQYEAAMKEGNYKAAAEFATEGLISGTLGLVGASHAYHAAGEAFKNLNPNEIEKLRPSDENYKMNSLFDKMDKRHQLAEGMSKNFEQDAYTALGAKNGLLSGLIKTAADKSTWQSKLDKLLMTVATGNDPEMARQYGNALAEAIGKPDHIMGAAPESAQDAINQIRETPEFKNWFEGSAATTDDGKPEPLYHGSNAAGFNEFSQENLSPYSLYGPGVYMTNSPDLAGEYAGFNKEGKPLPAIFGSPAFRGNIALKDIRDYFTPGKIVKSYGGYDKVIAFHEPEPNAAYPKNHWSVDVVETDKNGNPKYGARVRNHSSPPDKLNFAQEKGKAVYPLVASIKNPFDMDSNFSEEDAQQLFGKYNQTGWIQDLFDGQKTVNGDKLYNAASKAFGRFEDEGVEVPEDQKTEPVFPPGDSAKEAVNNLLKSNGYDGIKHTGGKIRGGVPHQVWIAFDPSQVKSTFDTLGQKLVTNIHIPEEIQNLVRKAKDSLSDEQKQHIERWMNAYHAVANGLDDNETKVYQMLRKMDDHTWNIGNAMGLIRTKIENHIHQIWDRPSTEIGNQTVQEGRTGGFETTTNTARHRVFQTYLEGLLNGYKIKGDNPVAVIGHDFSRVYKAAAHKNFLDDLRDQNIRASDGRPVVVMSGLGHQIAGPNGDTAAFINPNRVRNIKIADADVDRMRNSGALQRFLAKKDIIDITPKVRPDNIGSFIDRYEQMAEKQEPQYDAEGNNILRKKIEILKGVQDHKLPLSALDDLNAQEKPIYAWHPQDYVYPSHSAFKAWNWVMHTDNGTNVHVYSDMKLHPEISQYLLNRLGLDYSPLRDESTLVGKVGSKLLKAGSEAKSVLLSFSPFHANQEALRAIMLGVSPYQPDLKVDMADPLLKRGMRNGLTIFSNRYNLEQHSEGLSSHSKLISKIPVLGHAMDWYQDFLFSKYIPKLKSQAFKTMFDKYRSAHPDWSDDGVAKAAAEHVNNAFGGINYKALGRSTATQDWFRLFALAPDWLESEMRFASSMLHGGLGDRNFSREQVLKMAGGLWGAARIMNYLNTGNFHFEAPFGVATKDKNGREIIYSVRTMPTDILHMASNPIGFLQGRENPVLRIGTEAATGVNQYGQKMGPGNLAVDIARNMMPIPVQQLGQAISGSSPEVGNLGQAVKAAGITAEVYRTPAQKLAIDLASQRDEGGTLNPVQLRHLEALGKIEDGLRSGTMTYQQLEDAHDFGALTPDDYKKIRENLKLTHGLDPDTARMVTKVNRMTAPDALQVWDVATPREKTALINVMIRKKRSYMKKAFRSETPQERLNDGTFLRLRSMFQEPITENDQNEEQ